MQVILVPVAGRPECATALASAFQVAKSLRANVVGCHLRPHRHSKVSVPAELEDLIADATAAWEATARDGKVARESESAHELLAKVAQSYGLRVVKKLNGSANSTVMWQERVGSPEKVMRILGPTADMLVLSRPRSDASKLARLFLLEAMFRSHRPILIVPPDSVRPVGRRILIAWNQSGEAMRAVVAAMPLLQSAEKVTISVAGPEDSRGPKARQLAQYLRYWKVDADVVKTGGQRPQRQLMKVFRDTEADLLVMGAYSRNRLSRILFGGVTKYMLQQADIPVFMLHS
ncbi:MAG: universal stress protein [Gammaproteobacteria bacterium]